MIILYWVVFVVVIFLSRLVVSCLRNGLVLSCQGIGPSSMSSRKRVNRLAVHLTASPVASSEGLREHRLDPKV